MVQSCTPLEYWKEFAIRFYTCQSFCWMLSVTLLWGLIPFAFDFSGQESSILLSFLEASQTQCTLKNLKGSQKRAFHLWLLFRTYHGYFLRCPSKGIRNISPNSYLRMDWIYLHALKRSDWILLTDQDNLSHLAHFHKLAYLKKVLRGSYCFKQEGVHVMSMQLVPPHYQSGNGQAICVRHRHLTVFLQGTQKR